MSGTSTLRSGAHTSELPHAILSHPVPLGIADRIDISILDQPVLRATISVLA